MSEFLCFCFCDFSFFIFFFLVPVFAVCWCVKPETVVVGMRKKMIENMKDDGELEMLLDEIPHLYQRQRDDDDDDHDHDYGCFLTKQGNHGNGNGMYYEDDPLTQIKFSYASSPVSGFSLQSDGSSSSLFSSNGSPTPPPLEDLKSSTTMSMPYGSSYNNNPNNINNTFWLDSKIPDSTVTLRGEKRANDRLVHELGLCSNLSKMHIGNQQENPNVNVLPFRDFSPSENYRINAHHNSKPVDQDYNNSFKGGFLDPVGFQPPFSRSPMSHGAGMNPALSGGLAQDYEIANLFGSSRPCPGRHETTFSQLNGFSGSMDSPRHRRQPMNSYYSRGSLAPEPVAPLSRNSTVDASLYAQKYGMNLLEERGMSRLPNYSLRSTNVRPYMTVQDLLQYGLPLHNARAVPPSNARIPQGNIDAISSEGSFIIQGEGLNYVASRSSDRSRFQSATRETGFPKHPQRSELDMRHRVVGTYENPRSPRIGCPFSVLPKYHSLSEARGCIYLIAKDQHGCRFLQRVFDEGTPEDVQVIFNEIIDHVAELMMNPFGNYLMQKLLDVCNEEQRMQIILMVTEEPGQLVRISLNTHG